MEYFSFGERLFSAMKGMTCARKETLNKIINNKKKCRSGRIIN
jgi:hypothetical protein